MALSKYEIEKITEIVAGKMGEKIDGKAMRQVVDRIVDQLKENQSNPDIKSVTCDVNTNDKDASREIQETVIEKGEANKTSIAGYAGLYKEIEQTDATRIIIAAFGKNRPGVVAAITNVLAEHNCSIQDISQTIMQEFFSMIMVVDIKETTIEFSELRNEIQKTEAQLGMKVYVMHEDIFRYMHRI